MNAHTNRLHFMILILMLILSLAAFLLLAHKPLMQIVVVGLTVLSYIGWGWWHHRKIGNVHVGVMAEYVLVGVLVMVLVLGNLWLL